MPKKPEPIKSKGKVEKVMKDYKAGKLNSGVKTGSVTKTKKKAVASEESTHKRKAK